MSEQDPGSRPGDDDRRRDDRGAPRDRDRRGPGGHGRGGRPRQDGGRPEGRGRTGSGWGGGRDRRGDDRPGDRDRRREDRPREDRPRGDRPREERARGDRPREDRPREGRPRGERPRGDRPREDRPREDRHRDDRDGRARRDRDTGRAPRREHDRRDQARREGGRRERTAGPRNAGPPRGRVGPGRPPAVDPARQAAYELLTAVRERDAYANLALPGILRRHRLRDRDAALATELGYGTLRAQGLLDTVIDACTDRPLSKIEHPLLDALRLGAYQLLRTRVPAHAAVSTCVELVREGHGSQAAGFVNAVLRRIGEHEESEWLDRLAPDPAEDPVGAAALRHAHPRWIAQAFADALGDTGEELAAALAADDARPQVHLLARPGEITAEELALATGGEQAPWSPYGVHLEPGSGDIGELDAVAEGLAVVQDEGSQLVAAALARAELLGEDTGRWLDLCAGPGGKASLLGGLVAAHGGTLDAVESSEHRAGLVRAATAELPVTVHVADGREAPLPAGEYDRVFVDAPCTGLGALRRRPEARWRRRPEDTAALTRLQRELLVAALGHVRPGGVVAYVTCSPHVSETAGVVGRIVGRPGRPGPAGPVEQLDARAVLPEGMPGLGAGPAVQLWPHRHGTDAMYLALLRRPLG
ncbi:RsmB/NOP family class I SAM-dependent RNA methyltransferase [Pseudonocardia sp. C8]|nr:RsmB/NOP family class I SAM-dependent RNA methyltransferase [Pseudonocardia sp. C8]